MLSVDAWSEAAGAVVPTTLPMTGDQPTPFDVRPLPGARAVEILLRRDAHVLLWAEAPCEPSSSTRIHLAQSASGEWQVRASGAVRLAASRWRRQTPLRPHVDGPLELAFLIDGTMQRPASHDSALVTRLVGSTDGPWPATINELMALAHELSKGASFRYAALAFGDYALPGAVRTEMRPDYVVDPVETRHTFRTGDAAATGDALRQLRPTAGADFVDALADGLKAVSALSWSRDARKVLVIVGESPGYSVSDPPPRLTNAQVRSLDVDSQVRQLHALGIELVSVFSDVLSPETFQQQPDEHLRYTQDQYTALASTPVYAFRLSSFRGEDVARGLLAPPPVIVRDAFPGIVTWPALPT
jgi:hypothetical protein